MHMAQSLMSVVAPEHCDRLVALVSAWMLSPNLALRRAATQVCSRMM